MGRRATKICKRGHDKDVVGRSGATCVACKNIRKREIRAGAKLLLPGRPKDKCKRGHDLADTRPKGGRCEACPRDRYANKSKARQRDDRLRAFGITLEIYDSIVALQDGRCAVCGLTPVPIAGKTVGLFVDHDHESGLVRGLLCHYCNVGLGNFRDSPQRLRLAAKYLDDNYSEGRWPPTEDT